MLTIHDLEPPVTTLQRAELRALRGGSGLPALLHSLFGEFGFAETWSAQQTATVQSNSLLQRASVVSTVGGSGNHVVIDGGSQLGIQSNIYHGSNG
jgi:hypothetical protein